MKKPKYITRELPVSKSLNLAPLLNEMAEDGYVLHNINVLTKPSGPWLGETKLAGEEKVFIIVLVRAGK